MVLVSGVTLFGSDSRSQQLWDVTNTPYKPLPVKQMFSDKANVFRTTFANHPLFTISTIMINVPNDWLLCGDFGIFLVERILLQMIGYFIWILWCLWWNVL